MDAKLQLLKEVASSYLKSKDFNGIPVRSLNQPFTVTLPLIKELTAEGLISINYGDRHPNPHILAFEPESIEEQLKKVDKIDEHTCLYPTKKHLAKIVDKSKYAGKPFRLMLALGEPHLAFKPFDPIVLEHYRNDPRYSFDSDDIHGSLSIKSSYSDNGKVYKRDAVFLQTFGFAYTKGFTKRAVAVFVWYLANLSPEHQQLWFNKMLKGKYILHPDYAAASMGSWNFRESIFNAFIEELHHINEMVNLMAKPNLFNEVYGRENKPRGFSFLIRPTLKEFNDFTLILDKLMSENLNRDFFKGGLNLEQEERMKDGRVKVTQKGTITLLAEWFNRVRFPNPKPIDEMLTTFRTVRKLRQHPAHAIDEDVFDQEYFKKQRKLMIEAYGAIRTLRLVFANHPKVKGYEKIPDWLFKGEISTY
jgi:hypothetical protein